MAVKDAVRSCVWGIGADKQCAAIDVRKLEQLYDIEPVEGGPARPLDVVLLFALFACREIEAALRKVKHVCLEDTGTGCGVVTLNLVASLEN